MSLRVVVAAPFKQHGRDRLGESEFVVALSLDRDWVSPDQAKRVLDLASGEGLLRRGDDGIEAAFDVDDVTIPDEFQPDEGLFRERSTFERVLDDLVADGRDKQESVAAINRLQHDLEITVEAAAVVYARRQGLDVASHARQARESL